MAGNDQSRQGLNPWSKEMDFSFLVLGPLRTETLYIYIIDIDIDNQNISKRCLLLLHPSWLPLPRHVTVSGSRFMTL